MGISRGTSRAGIVTRMAIMLAGLWVLAACSSGPPEPAIPAEAGFSSWFDNGADGRYVLPVIGGALPAAVRDGMWGRVLTDSDCAPDAAGLNHCHNIIELSDGSRITVTNNHQMTRHRCLKPGETVRVGLLKDNWITVHTRT
jgi:hypothetical protein